MSKQRHINLERTIKEKSASTKRKTSTGILSYLEEIVTVASVLSPGVEHESHIRCRRRPAQKKCSGTLILSRSDIEDHIQWLCPLCDDQGKVSDWQNSPWNREPALKTGEVVSLLQVRAERANNISPVNHRACHEYEFLIELVSGPLELNSAISRKIRIGGARTLHDLHLLIQRAFDRSGEEPYEFMFGAPYEPKSKRYSGGFVGEVEENDVWETQKIELEQLDIEIDQRFGYLFDFGEEWVHRITLLAISEEPTFSIHPRVVEKNGSSPPQFSTASELWESEIEWSEFSDDYPLTALYGPYDGNRSPDIQEWQSIDELARLLLIIESHSQKDFLKTNKNHPSISSQTVHALVHSLAETALADNDNNEQSHFAQLEETLSSRHLAIHRFGYELLLSHLDEIKLKKTGKFRR